MQTDPKKPARDEADTAADPDAIVPDIEDGDHPAEKIDETGEPFDDNFA